MCKRIGMVWKNKEAESEIEVVQPRVLNYSPLSLTCSNTKTPTTPTTSEYPTLILFGNQTNFDYNDLLYKLKAILRGPIKTIRWLPGQYFTTLQSLCYGLREFEKAAHPFKANEIVRSNILNYTLFLEYQNNACIAFAHALLYSREFNQMSLTDRALLFNHSWPFFSAIEKIFHSLQTFGYDSPEVLIFSDNKHAANEEFARVICDQMDEKRSLHIFELFRPSNEHMLNCLYKPMKALKLDLIEFTYIIGQVLWSEEIAGFSQEGMKLARNIIISLNNDIHGYYCFNKNLSNYSYRLSQIVKLINQVHAQMSIKSEVMTAGRIFDLFDAGQFYSEKLDLNNPGLIYLMK
uniref:NR LBD domain-containing protein n=1 Tax=Rhabditophanes sp. KR3021 TaxID=114890 RepID=A0AC35TP84_9BILA